MTAAELAGGLLFNQGQAARYLTALGRPNIKMSSAMRILQWSVDRRLKQHPKLAAAFARDVQSGNRIQVTVGLKILGEFTNQALTSEFGRATTRRIEAQAVALLGSPAAMVPNGSGSDNAYNAVQAAAYLLLAAVVVVAVVFALVALAFSVHSGPDRLAAERVVNLVTIGLQAAR